MMPYLDDLCVEEIAPQELHLPRLLVKLVVCSFDRLSPQLSLQECFFLVGAPPLGLNQLLLLLLPVLLWENNVKRQHLHGACRCGEHHEGKGEMTNIDAVEKI